MSSKTSYLVYQAARHHSYLGDKNFIIESDRQSSSKIERDTFKELNVSSPVHQF
jgi:hypothetical protein